ncbi:hypothetical protein N7454_003698 [Penicillium verhagenii]|nr:hypothetical protein N7454_003698 [Penicillium verhagenii]
MSDSHKSSNLGEKQVFGAMRLDQHISRKSPHGIGQITGAGDQENGSRMRSRKTASSTRSYALSASVPIRHPHS